jgi:hypothetical protein
MAQKQNANPFLGFRDVLDVAQRDIALPALNPADVRQKMNKVLLP